MKKILLKLGTFASIVMPIATIIACGQNTTKTRKFDLLPTYTGQADQMIALNIKSDYYPLQLNEKNMYSYLLNPQKHMQLQDKLFQDAFTKKIKSLIPPIKGDSWWNQEALNSYENEADPVYWKKQEGKVVLYEHYLLDDDSQIINNANAPKHNPASTIQTNFRSSRDPYTRIPKAVFFGWDLTDLEIDSIISSPQQLSIQTITLNGEAIVVNKNIAQIIKNLRTKHKQLINSTTKKTDWLYNDYYFVDSYHRMFLDNNDFQNSHFKNWLVDSTNASPFKGVVDSQEDANKLQQLFDASTFQTNEIVAGIGPSSTISSHHPIYEQQKGKVGTAPMFEGAMRDNMLYLFNISWQLTNLAKYGTPFGQQHYDELPQTIEIDKRDKYIQIVQSKEEAKEVKNKIIGTLKPHQISAMQNAFQNAIKISTQLETRMAQMKIYFQILKANGKVFGISTIAPGHGESTIQSISKYSFLYKELGFKQPLPNNLDDLARGASKFTNQWNKTNGTNIELKEGQVHSKDRNINDAIGNNALFNMNDNGWFWILGENGEFNVDKAQKFQNQFDMGVIAARDKEFNSEIRGNQQNQMAFAKLFKDGQDQITTHANHFLHSKQVDYNLWNEGIKTPFAMHMILDKIVEVTETWTKNEFGDAIDSNLPQRQAALNWGDYFRKDFAKLSN